MKFEEAVNTPRLSPDKEITIEGVHEYHQNIDEMRKNDLLVQADRLREQINFLKKESQSLDELNNLSSNYERAKPILDNFKTSKASLEKVVSENSDKLKELGGDTVSDALQSERLMQTDEVEEYQQSKEKLRKHVSRIARQKKKAQDGVERIAGDISFRSSQRKESLNKAFETSSKISGSIKALESEYARLISELSKRANEYYSSVILKRDEQAGRKLMEDSNIDGLVQQRKEHLVEIASEFGPEAAVSLGSQSTENADLLKEAVFSYEVTQEMDAREQKLEKISEKEETIKNLALQHDEVEEHLLNLFGKPLSDLPLNIQVIDPKGYQGLHTDEGKLVAYAFNYEGKDAVSEIEQKLEGLKDSLSVLEDKFKTANSNLIESKLKKKASFFDFALKSVYKKRETELSNLQNQIDALKLEIEQAENELVTAQEAVVVTKEPVEMDRYLKDVDFINHLYVHNNYGRGYEEARKKNPIQTVEDFFVFFTQKLKNEISELQKVEKDIFIDRCIALRESGNLIRN